MIALAALGLLLLLPVATVVWLAFGSATGVWAHLTSTVLPSALRDTLSLVAGVGAATLVIGTGTAWLVTMYRFPGRAVLDRLLVLPLAMPTYIVAYALVDLADFTGPFSGVYRSLFGWQTARQAWLPDLRSQSGAIFVLSIVLYPYVYLSARASFVQQSICVLEVARTLGRTASGAFWSVALPLARPALAAGVALVAMECMNDLGALQYLGVSTLTVSVYTTWLQRGSLAGAAQIALVALVFVALLIGIERRARGGSRHHHTTGRYRSIPFSDLRGWRGRCAFVACLLPPLLGFGLPVLVLLGQAIGRGRGQFSVAFFEAARNSVLLAAACAALTVAIALALAYARRIGGHGRLGHAIALAGAGYALPGTVLAIGLMIPLAAFDNAVDAFMRARLGISTGLLLSGSLAALLLAYTIRFLAVSLGAIEAGFERLSPNLDAVARTLGETAMSALRRVHLPMLAPALGAAALLVFVDAMKELPATLLLRPFNFETLATHVYAFAALEQFEQGAAGALAIVLAGLAPVLLLHRAVASGRAGS